jgi:hypothetical protein
MNTITQVATLDDSILSELVSDYLDADQGISKHITEKTILEGGKPQMSPIYDTIQEYNQYIDAFNAYNASVEKWNSLFQILESEKVLAEKALIQVLPANTWFRSIWKDKPVWVGYSTSNWGGGTRAVSISFTMPEKMLRHVNYD